MPAELTLTDSWQLLTDDPRAILVDVRTAAEWKYVGLPDLSELGKNPRLVEWIDYPAGARNPDFVRDATDGIDRDQPILLLCRSGVRSAAAADALAAAGFEQPINVTAGFEGDLGADGHRHGGWKFSLPWKQS